MRGPIDVGIGESTGKAILRTEMAKLDACTILSFDVDKRGKNTCYDEKSGDELSPEVVCKARRFDVYYITEINVYDVVSRRDLNRSCRAKLIKNCWLDASKYMYLYIYIYI